MNLDYEKRYKGALEKAYIAYKDEDKHLKATLERIFPELKRKESEERTRKAILTGLIDCRDAPDLLWSDFGGINIDECIAWLEKQGEQHSPVDIDKMVDEFANTEIEGYGFPSMIEVDAYRKGIEDVFEKQDGQTKLDYEHEELPEKDLEDLFQALPEKIVDEKSHQVYELCVYHYDGQCVVDYVGEIDHDSLYTFGGDTLYDAMEKAWNWLRKNSTGV